MLYSKYENVYYNQYTVFIICWHLVCMNPLINVDFIHVLFMVSLDKKTFLTFFSQKKQHVFNCVSSMTYMYFMNEAYT